MLAHSLIEDASLRARIRHGEIRFAGNRRLRIYGRLTCGSGKRMLDANRVFFMDEAEALAAGYRPCGHCMKKQFEHRRENEAAKGPAR